MGRPEMRFRFLTRLLFFQHDAQFDKMAVLVSFFPIWLISVFIFHLQQHMLPYCSHITLSF
jgi:hypothetical protein